MKSDAPSAGTMDSRSAERQVGAEQKRATPPTINLPKGGGAIRGIGEKFAANPVTGSGSMTVPIATSLGRSGFGPQMALSYDSGAGNGPFGFGWSFGLPQITRKTDKGLPKYQDALDSDIFILSGAEDLVPALDQQDGTWVRDSFERTVDGMSYRIDRYRPRVEGLFARIERWTNRSDASDVFWRSISKANVTTWYGRTQNSRIADPNDAVRIFSWLICESCDDKGNVVAYEYKAEDSENVDLSQAHERNRTVKTRSANLYLKRIKYGNRTPYLPILAADEPESALPEDWLFEIVFDYGEHDTAAPGPDDGEIWAIRNDPFSTYRAGFELRTYRICQRVLVFHHVPDGSNGEKGYDGLVRSTDFTYAFQEDPTDARNPIFSKLVSITQSGYKRQEDGTYLKQSLPPIEFAYSEADIQAEIREVDSESLENLPDGLNGRYQWLDLDGEGIAGILSEQATAWFYKRNLSPANIIDDNGTTRVEPWFAPVEVVASKPAATLATRAQFLDLAGDGRLDLVNFETRTPGFYERTTDERWEDLTSFLSLPRLDWQDPNLKFIDLTGDGRADILISEDEVFTWYPSLGEEGFGPSTVTRLSWDEEKGPRLLFSDREQTIYLADLSGDGLTDLVRIRNGEVCYWPNLGYGCFGAKVTMDNAPWFDTPDLFDQRRIRLADIDGSGVTDIIYLRADGIRIYFNQSGNSWSAPVVLKEFPAIDSLVSVQVTDLLSNGTACLVWSSPLPGDARQPLRYLDLMGGQKPHLLVGVVNNLGAETRVQYAPSTRFYVADKLAGNPWITKLPFPVHVVECVETWDDVSRNRFVSRYAYHHGYFDGEEREFRGFGMVEQFDTEELAALNTSGDLTTDGNLDEESYVPPVHTKTWFHTGVYLERDRISNFFAGLIDGSDAGEYYREPGLTDAGAEALLLADTALPDGLTADEEREACRALKGSILRQEIYALDDTDKATHPYRVSERNYTLKCLQPRGTNPYAVFFAHPGETIDYDYERNPADPRVNHSLTLQVDDTGNILKSATIAYGRRQPSTELPLATDQTRQTTSLLTWIESDFTNAILEADSYLAPLPSASRTYELTGYSPSGAGGRFQASDFVTVDPADPEGLALLHIYDSEIAYEESAGTGRQRRLIEHTRSYYRPADFGNAANDPLALLALGEVEMPAIPGETYKLSFTPGLLNKVFTRRQAGLPDEALLPIPGDVLEVAGAQIGDRGGYVDLDNDGCWWIPSGRIFYSPNTSDTAAEELAHARDHFFLPRRYRDAFGQTTTVNFDSFDLLMTETRDALDNRVTAGERNAAGELTQERNDYRVLQPALVMDPNRNRTAVTFDSLGMVTGTALMGKSDENVGDSLDGFVADLTSTQIDTFLADPTGAAVGLLGNATTRIIYDLERFRNTAASATIQPVFAATLARETHASEPPPSGQSLKVQVSFSYSDGFGREIQQKIQAEPGEVEVEDENGNVTTVDTAPELRWVGSGWTIFNNKGKPVRRYEPFFSTDHHFQFGRKIGVSPVLFYDPVGRVVATLHPNHTWEKVVFDSWSQETWDVNDTILIGDPSADADVGAFVGRLQNGDYQPTWYAQRAAGALGEDEQTTAEKTASHADTPTMVYLDTLGRPFLSIVDNGAEGKYETRTELDIRGLPLAITDARGNQVMAYSYDLLKRRIYSQSMDAGDRWNLPDAADNPIRAWDSREQTFRTTYDELRRPTRLFVKRGSSVEMLVERTVFGEAHSDADMLNLRGKVYQQYDGAGVVTNEGLDFKGNLLQTNRRLAVEYKTTVDWVGLQDLADTEEIKSAAEALLEEESFTHSTAYDALNRPIRQTLPDQTEIQPTYNEANLLEQVKARLRGATDWTTFVEGIDYNAKGQRELIEYGNGVVTEYGYDELTFRLVSLKTTRDSEGDLQNLTYTYDPAGNITSIRDDAQQTIYFGGQEVTPDAEYVYDAIYRLIEATGREHIGQTAQLDENDPPIQEIPHPNDAQAMRRYGEKYFYDEVGNILKMAHAADNANWTRYYEYEETSNRLAATSLSGDDPLGPYSAKYTHDAHGNMTTMPHLVAIEWDFKDRMQQTDLGGGGMAYFIYDASGQRVRKVHEHNGSTVEERIYVGRYEVYRKWQGVLQLERETVHIMDDKRRIALIETKTYEDMSSNEPITVIRYQVGNHLGSACLELDDEGAVISYEEYHPYGTTAHRAASGSIEVSTKRYRYSGKEKDEETAFYYYGGRYYACWIARWTAPDPLGIKAGVNLYVMVSCNPSNRIDIEGFWDPAAFADTLDGFVDVAENAYLTEGTGIGAVLANTAVATTADIVKGSTSILRVGQGAYEGVERIKNAEDAWDIAIGTSLILSDAGEVASSALGVAGTAEKAVQTAQVSMLKREIRVAQAKRGAADLSQAERVTLSEQIGELNAQKEFIEAGYSRPFSLSEPKRTLDVGPGDVKRIPENGGRVVQGVDQTYRSVKPLHAKDVTVEVKGYASTPARGNQARILEEDVRGLFEGADDWNLDRLNQAADSGNRNAREMLNRLNGEAPESYLSVTNTTTGDTIVSRLEGQTGRPQATPLSELDSVSPVFDMVGTALVDNMSRGAIMY